MNAGRWRRVVAALVLLVALVAADLRIVLAAPGAAEARDYFALIVSGASGGAEYAERYDRWRSGLVAALRAQAGFRDDHLRVLAETPGRGVGCATREGVRRAVQEIAARMHEQSVLFVVLLGHGTFDGEDAKFNLVGPDLAAADWAALVDPLPGRLVFVNTTAASAPFLAPLARADRIVITATESPVQRYATVFPEFLGRAFVDEASDTDRNGRVSVWEAFTYASAGVRRWYQERGRLATERAVLDDTGDGHGIDAGEGEDGRRAGLASAVYVGAGVDAVSTGGAGTWTGWRRAALRSRSRWPSSGRRARGCPRSATRPSWSGSCWSSRECRGTCGF